MQEPLYNRITCEMTLKAIGQWFDQLSTSVFQLSVRGDFILGPHSKNGLHHQTSEDSHAARKAFPSGRGYCTSKAALEP